ncbi:hypothetical protein D3C83_36730 [compost metagenome]
MIGRDGGAEEPERLQLLDDLPGIGVVRIERAHDRAHVPVEEAVHALQDERLVARGCAHEKTRNETADESR